MEVPGVCFGRGSLVGEISSCGLCAGTAGLCEGTG